MTFTVMTYNIRSGKNMAGDLNIAYAAQVISDMAPDLVNVNEVRNRSADVGRANQAQQLGDLLGMSWRFGKSIPFMGGMYGNAMLSRYPVLSSEVVHIPDIGPQFEHRTVFKNVLDIQGQTLTLLGSHFGLSAAEQENGVKTVLSLAEKIDGPIVLMGDLNTRPDDPVLAPLYEVFTDCFGGAVTPHTYPAISPEIKIDYIMVRGLTVLNALSISSLNSDHLPLFAMLSLDPAAARPVAQIEGHISEPSIWV